MLPEVRSAPAGTRSAIFYGAMHLRDMHRRLYACGFTHPAGRLEAHRHPRLICFFRMPRKSGVFSVYQPVYKVVYHVYTKEVYHAMSQVVALIP